MQSSKKFKALKNQLKELRKIEKDLIRNTNKVFIHQEIVKVEELLNQKPKPFMNQNSKSE